MFCDFIDIGLVHMLRESVARSIRGCTSRSTPDMAERARLGHSNIGMGWDNKPPFRLLLNMLGSGGIRELLCPGRHAPPRKSIVSAEGGTQTHRVKERIEQLRATAAPLEPDRQVRQSWTERVTAHAQEFVESLARRPVFQPAPGEGKGILAEKLSESPTELGSLLGSLSNHVEEPGLKLGAPGFMGFIPISSLYPAALGDYLAAVLNPFSGNFFAAPGAVRLEHLLTRWMAEFIGYPPNCAGDLTSGGSISNLSAIVAAREAHCLK